MYEGHMDKAKAGGRQGWVGQGECGRVKMETIVLEQQQQKENRPQKGKVHLKHKLLLFTMG